MPEIEIRPAVPQDIPLLVEIEHHTQSNYVWQMDRVVNEGEINIHFREIRLPRAVRIEYPRKPASLLTQWTQRTQVLVAAIEGMPVGCIGLSDQQAPSTAWVNAAKGHCLGSGAGFAGVGHPARLAAHDPGNAIQKPCGRPPGAKTWF